MGSWEREGEGNREREKRVRERQREIEERERESGIKLFHWDLNWDQKIKLRLQRSLNVKRESKIMLRQVFNFYGLGCGLLVYWSWVRIQHPPMFFRRTLIVESDKSVLIQRVDCRKSGLALVPVVLTCRNGLEVPKYFFNLYDRVGNWSTFKS